MDSIAKFVGYAFIFLVALNLYSNWKTEADEPRKPPASLARCNILSVNTQEDAYFLKEDLDFGYTVATEIENQGEKGQIDITAILSTSEGTFQRAQSLTFQKGQKASLRYQFHEPTINASGVQGRIRCSAS